MGHSDYLINDYKPNHNSNIYIYMIYKNDMIHNGNNI